MLELCILCALLVPISFFSKPWVCVHHLVLLPVAMRGKVIVFALAFQVCLESEYWWPILPKFLVETLPDDCSMLQQSLH
jgi:hypothetical protein